MKNIIIIQHTESMHHVNKMTGSWTDWDLTELGLTQAKNIALNLKDEFVNKTFILYSSDLKRATQTAKYICDMLNITPIIRDELREVNIGDGCNKTTEWYKINKNIKNDDVFDPDHKIFINAESDRDFWNRICKFGQEILNNENENIIIVAHKITDSFLISYLLGDKLEDLGKRRFLCVSGGVSKIVIENNGKAKLMYLNNLSYVK